MRPWMVLGFVTACGGGAFDVDGGEDDAIGDTGDVSEDTAGVEETGEPPEPTRDVCARWNSDRLGMTEGSWSGSVASCDPGDISAEGRASALRMVNLYRWLADLPEVETSTTRDEAAQACALMMDANDALSHSPGSNWACYSQQGADAAARSNISSGPGTMSVDMYMVDPGNDTTLGHRRWILSNSAGPIGLGSTDDSSCMHILGGSGNAGRAWTAWPPPGGVPLQALNPDTVWWSTTDETGWSVQSDSIDLRNAAVMVSRDGVALNVGVSALAGGYGSSSALAIRPSGWVTEPGTYTVTVEASQTIEYEVEVLDCGS